MKPRPFVISAFVGLFLCTAALTGCAHVGLGAEAPEVTARGVSIQSVGLTGLRGTIHLSVFNPNAFSVPLQRARFTIDIGGASLATGEMNLAATIPAKASAPVDAAITVDGVSAAAVAARMSAGARGYVLRGTLYFSTRLGTIPVDITHQGDIGEFVAPAI